MIKQRPVARVVFDEFHSESWSSSAERARAMQPADPANASYQRAADALAARDFTVRRNVASPIDGALLAETDVLALVHPCDSKWERTTSQNPPALSPDEIAAIQDFVRAGGGLVIIAENEHDKYGDNLNELLAPTGLRIENGVAFDRTSCVNENPEWVLGEPQPASPLAHRASRACFYRAGWLAAREPATVEWRTSGNASPPAAGLIGTARFGGGRVVVVTDSNLFGDERFGALDHQQLWLNLVYWCAAPAFAREAVKDTRSPALPSCHWTDLKAAVNQLRLLESSDGSVPAAEHTAALPLIETIVASIAALRPLFPHQAAHLDQLVQDFQAWTASGLGRPNFAVSLAAFHPEQHRRDRIEHLVVFPLYTPNASSDTRCEALLVRTPWPDWLAALERTHFHNPKFVPGHLIDFTDGYASECAVLFPETVPVTGPAANHFGVIFCDREARRLQACTRRAAEAVRLILHPELECWLSSLALIRDTTALWDLIHDRAHSLGELPFDPFMIRQRAPFWMYGLEELRVDLRSYGEAARLAEEGFSFARYVCWAIVLDRIFRFPITGTRVRNYDALGGQLLFSYLHQKDVILWQDNRLTIRWEALDAGIAGLREELTTLYKLGADCSKMTFWLSAHDLVSRYVRPNVASQWKAETRAISDEDDVKRWLALVHPDEFPLGNFHLNLLRRLK
ncbi:MAG: hypothetical protein QOE70_5554 [Chthoniobacter sp.]|jgi:hypothetical protein|nr:hypothetical protein [Chthoniobacter sp.]